MQLLHVTRMHRTQRRVYYSVHDELDFQVEGGLDPPLVGINVLTTNGFMPELH